jgi:hypothetical protein
MLADLLSPTSVGDLAVRYSPYSAILSPAATAVRQLYAYGLKDLSGASERLWSDAEDFIDYLDTAAAARKEGTPNPHWDRLRNILNRLQLSPDAETLRGGARRLVAAECCAFLEGVDTRREQWEPYRDWVESLAPIDTVITFNYDRVIEMLRDTDDRRVAILTPAGLNGDPGLFRDHCAVLKLHGSVDWRRRKVDASYLAEETNDPHFALKCEDEEIAIATPGPSKRAASKELGALWSKAQVALANADAIVFVGYRFPETDAHARKTLLEAIRENHRDQETHHLAIHVVLGGHPQHTSRLAALMQNVCGRNRDAGLSAGRSFRVHEHPLFAQDFFTALNRSGLFG